MYNPLVSTTVTESPPASVNQRLQQIEADLVARMDRLQLPDNLKEAVRYAVLGGGKRLRPLLIVSCCEAVGGERSGALAPAAAMELIHTFSLVHDDLPAMDDDALRRGRPTLHVHSGEAMAILAGDAMMSLAFQFIAESPLSADCRAKLAAELAAGTTAMIAGQVLDTIGGFAANLTDRQRLNLIHRNKTASLIRASCRMGGICGSADGEQLAALTTYGEAIGLMFQIVDDILDVTQSAEHIGKAAGKDESAGKLTFPGLLGLDASRTEVKRLQTAAHQALAPLGKAAATLLELCDYLAVRTR